MLNLPMVAAGEYDADRPLAVFADLADAEEYARRYNAERGYGLADGDRARVESIAVFPSGDPGRSGHEVKVEQSTNNLGSAWSWTCTCGQHGVWLGERVAREQAAQHIAHWTGAVPQPALPN